MKTREPGSWSPTHRAGTVVVILLVLAMGAYLLTKREELAYFSRLSVQVLLLTLVCQFAAQLSWNAAMLLPLRSYVKLGYWELFLLRAGGLLASYGVPVAGNIGLRLAYLRKRGVAYDQFAWATIISNVLSLAAAAALALIASAVLWARAGWLSAPTAGLTAGVALLAFGGAAALHFGPRLAGRPRFQRWRWVAGMSRHEASRGTLVRVSACSFGRHAFNFASFGLLYQGLLRAPGEFVTGGLVYALTTPVRIVAITPGNIGVNEWVTAAVGKLLSFDLTTGLIVALVFRAAALVAVFAGVVAAAAWFALRGDA